MPASSFMDELAEILERYIRNARAELDARWAEWPLDLSRTHIHEVVGGLLARQVSLAVNVAAAPPVWNPHAGPVLLRAMTDVVITLAWILEKPDERSKQYIEYGLGQVKLDIERRKADFTVDDLSEAERKIIEVSEAWLQQQRWPFLTEVNLGSWSDVSTRQMAQETGLIDFYNYTYQLFSGAAHSMWQHVGRFNVQPCHSPLHRYHRVPVDPDIPPDFYWLELAAKYLLRAFQIFDDKSGVTVTEPSSYERLGEEVDDLNRRHENSAQSSEA
jgi:hypothetical protein